MYYNIYKKVAISIEIKAASKTKGIFTKVDLSKIMPYVKDIIDHDMGNKNAKNAIRGFNGINRYYPMLKLIDIYNCIKEAS